MSQQILQAVESPYLKEKVDEFGIGDTVDVYTKIQEGQKERIQIFSGTVIAKSGSGSREMFVVRRIVGGEGVERLLLRAIGAAEHLHMRVCPGSGTASRSPARLASPPAPGRDVIAAGAPPAGASTCCGGAATAISVVPSPKIPG